jgi:flagellar hook-basal body protein
MPPKATTLAAFRCNLDSAAGARIPDLQSIPGGDGAIPRPHVYTSYSGRAVTYAGLTQPTTASDGETYFNTGDGKIYTRVSGAWSTPQDAAPNTFYYGANTDAPGPGVFSSVYTDGATSGPAVASRQYVDLSGASAPAAAPMPDAGTTYLDASSGDIWRVNSAGTAWEQIGSMQAGTAYAARDAGVIYLLDSVPAVASAASVLDLSDGNKNVFSVSNGEWRSLNDAQLSPSGASAATAAGLAAFGTSMMESHDWKDDFVVYDSSGNPHKLTVVFRKALDRPAQPDASPPASAESEWDWYAYYVNSDGTVDAAAGSGGGTLVFGDGGLLNRSYYYEPGSLAVVEKNIGNPGDDGKATGRVGANFSSGSSGPITLDFLGSDYARSLGLSSGPIDGVTSFGSDSTTKMKAQDGYTAGVLNGWSVDGGGVITGSYSNGKTRPIYKVALAMFANPQGLVKVGTTCFAESENSGIAQIGSAGQNGAGSIVGTTVEMSNVDLSEEFVNLIRSQRGLQANTRVVTTSDQILEVLINMKR